MTEYVSVITSIISEVLQGGAHYNPSTREAEGGGLWPVWFTEGNHVSKKIPCLYTIKMFSS